MKEFTPRNAAKYAAQAIIASKTSQIAEDVITDYTRFEDDDIVVDISGHFVGWYVSSKLRPVTDTMVDKAADFISAKREQLKTKKETSTEV